MIVPGDPGEGPGLIQRDGCATGLVIEVRASKIIEGIQVFSQKTFQICICHQHTLQSFSVVT